MAHYCCLFKHIFLVKRASLWEICRVRPSSASPYNFLHFLFRNKLALFICSLYITVALFYSTIPSNDVAKQRSSSFPLNLYCCLFLNVSNCLLIAFVSETLLCASGNLSNQRCHHFNLAQECTLCHFVLVPSFVSIYYYDCYLLPYSISLLFISIIFTFMFLYVF